MVNRAEGGKKKKKVSQEEERERESNETVELWAINLQNILRAEFFPLFPPKITYLSLHIFHSLS